MIIKIALILLIKYTFANENYEGYVDKKFKNGNDWSRYCILDKPEDTKRPFTHCTLNMYPYETIGIKCPRLKNRNYDLFPIQENQIYISDRPNNREIADPSTFIPEELNIIGNNLSSIYDKDGYNVILYNSGTNQKFRSIYYICGLPSINNINHTNIDTMGIALAVINIVFLPNNTEKNNYLIDFDNHPMVMPHQDLSMIREIDENAIYKMTCTSGDLTVVYNKNHEKISDSGILQELENKYNLINNLNLGNSLSVKASDLIYILKYNPDNPIEITCKVTHSYDYILDTQSPSGSLITNPSDFTKTHSLKFIIPLYLNSPICSTDAIKSNNNFIYSDSVLCKYNASTAISSIYCPQTHSFDIQACKDSFYEWQKFKTNRINYEDFNIIAINDYYMFLYKNLTSPFTHPLICSCKPNEGVNLKEVKISITPKMECDFIDSNPHKIGIFNNICSRVIRPGESLIVTCNVGDSLYPSKGLSYNGDFDSINHKLTLTGSKKSDFDIKSIGLGKFMITLSRETNVFLGQRYVYICSNGKGIRETGFPTTSGGITIITTGNPNFPQSTEDRLPTLVNKLKPNEYGYYNLKLSPGNLEFECKNYLYDTTQLTSALYPINWTDMYSEQPKKGVDPRTMPLIHPNKFMGFHGVSFKKLPEKQALPSVLSISIQNDAIVLPGTQFPLYFVCMDNLQDGVWDENKGRFAVFEIEFDLEHKELPGCGVHPQMFRDSMGNVMNSNNCTFDMTIHEKVGFHCPLTIDSGDPPICYALGRDKNSPIDIFKRPVDLHEFRSLWIFTKNTIKDYKGGIECLCVSDGKTLAKITINNVDLIKISIITIIILYI